MTALAAIDIGSNSVRLLVTDRAGNERTREMNITRLAQGVDLEGNLAEEAMARTTTVLEAYGRTMRALGVSAARVTATSAARDAGNRERFFDRVQRAVGFRPELLSGEQEAALSFAGATAGLPRARQGPTPSTVTLDIGGGSTEFALGREAVESSISIDMGCVRVTERFLTGDPPSSAQLDAATQFVRAQLERVEAAVPCRTAGRWLGLAGTVTSLAALDLGLPRYDPTQTHGHALRAARIEQLHDELCALSTAQRAARLLEPKRAEVLIGGSLILAETVRFFGLEAIGVSERDILDGLAESLRVADRG